MEHETVNITRNKKYDKLVWRFKKHDDLNSEGMCRFVTTRIRYFTIIEMFVDRLHNEYPDTVLQ